MKDSPTELGRIIIKCDENLNSYDCEFHPFEMEYEWQKRKVRGEELDMFLLNLVEQRELILCGGECYAAFCVAAKFMLDSSGNICGISRLALLESCDFIEIIK